MGRSKVPFRVGGLLLWLVIALPVFLLGTAFFAEFALRTGVWPNELRPVVSERGSSGRRLLIVGDSFLSADNSVYRNMLDQAEWRDFQLHNVAVVGTGPAFYYHRLRYELDRIQPDHVLLGYYTGNDFSDLHYKTYEQAGFGSYSFWLFRRYLHQASNRLRLDSGKKGGTQEAVTDASLESAASEKLRSVGLNKSDRQQLLQILGRKYQINPHLLQLHRDQQFLDGNLLLQADWADQVKSKFSDYFEKTVLLLRKKQVKFSIVIFPHSLQVNQAQTDWYQLLGFTKKDRYQTEARSVEFILRECQRLAVHCHSFLSQFRQAERNMYFAYDDHLNFVATRQVSRWLSEIVSGQSTSGGMPVTFIQ